MSPYVCVVCMYVCGKAPPIRSLSLLSKKMSVSLHVDILEARNLIDADRSISAMLQSNDTSDPFVSVMLMGFHDDEKEEIGRTEVVKNDVNPVWKYSMVKRHIDMNETGVVRLSVRDYDQFSKDSKLGNVDLPMLGLIGKGNVEGWYVSLSLSLCMCVTTIPPTFETSTHTHAQVQVAAYAQDAKTKQENKW